MKAVTAVAIASVWLTVGLPAQAWAQGVPATTHRLATCLRATDQAVCLLKVLAASPTHFPSRTYASRSEFLGASPDLMLEIEGATPLEAQANGAALSPADAYKRLPLQIGPAVRSALQADHGGKAPEDALAPIRNLGQGLPPLVLGGLITISPADTRWRADAYGIIWDAYRDPKLAADKRPSKRLAKAAVDGWSEFERSHDNAPPGEQAAKARVRMDAYGALGDEAGVRREAEGLREPSAVRAMDVLLALGKLDAAAKAAIALTAEEAAGPEGRQDARARVLAAAMNAGRVDLGRAIADARVRDAISSNSELPACWLDHGPAGFSATPVCSNIEALAERADAAARAGNGARAMEAAVWAAEAWVRIGRPARAQALLALYLPHAVPEAACRYSPPCNRYGIEKIALWTGDYKSAADMRVANLPQDFIVFDVEHGRGLTNLDAHMARSENPAWTDLGLTECAEKAADLRLWDIASGCVHRLATRIDRPLAPQEVKLGETTTDAGSPRLMAVGAAWWVAGLAGRAGQGEASRKMIDLALRLAQGGDDHELPVGTDVFVEMAAIAELRAEHRL
jgi:hypothetical protein